jgi:[ribosomal protein S5]-alanine N-acetyltransferase
MHDRQPILTPRLVLEPVHVDVARAVVAGDLSGVRAGRGWPHGDTLGALQFAVDHNGALGWFIVLDGVVIGDCGTHGGPDEQGSVEIGYGLAQPYRGQGYATEAADALADWLLRRPGVRRVVASTLRTGNPASRRVLEKAGFQCGGEDEEFVWYVRRA